MKVFNLAAFGAVALASSPRYGRHLKSDGGILVPDDAIEGDSVEVDTIASDVSALGMTVYYSTTDFIWSSSHY